MWHAEHTVKSGWPFLLASFNARTEESLVAIAKDVWTYDLNEKETDLKTVELYVKPEEGLCYYVFNGDVTGSFVI